MSAWSSGHFTPLSLQQVFNARREELDGSLRLAATSRQWYGSISLRGIPFTLGPPDQPNVILLDQQEISAELESCLATYVLFLHAVADRPDSLPADLLDAPAAGTPTGNEVGALVAEYRLEYTDGSAAATPIRRRLAIQQARVVGGVPFAAVTARGPEVLHSARETALLGRPGVAFGRGETRLVPEWELSPEHLWIYALANPYPEKAIRRIMCAPRGEVSIIYAITHTQLAAHPLQWGLRRKLRVTLPPGAMINALGELEGAAFDLGTVISARLALDYDHAAWLGPGIDVQPARSAAAVIVEYQAHQAARLFVPTGPAKTDVAAFDLADLERQTGTQAVPSASQPVQLRFVEAGSSVPVPVRLHLHGAAGEYLPPRGHHRKVNDGWCEDFAGEFVNGLNQYCYIPGECVVDLPQGEVFLQATHGYEVAPLRTRFVVTPETRELTFTLDRTFDWRRRGWVTADTHVHFLSPQTALLEGAAEGVNVVNLLASQWGELFTNVGDFDGRTTFGAKEFGGDGEFLVRVGSENRMNLLGHVSLLGYSGALIQPLCTGGPAESAIGDPLEVSMADWAQRCFNQQGLVIMPHLPNPQAERPADIILGLVHAVELMTFTPFEAQLSPYALADWYRYLNLGYHLPVVGGSDKMGANILLGGIRTYTHLGEREFTYANWMAAIKAGNTFVTVGPLVEFAVEGLHPGQCLRLPASGGRVTTSWRVESAGLPIERVEIVVGGLAADQSEVGGQRVASGHLAVEVAASTWIAARVRGSYRGVRGDLAAHTSAVQVLVGDAPIFAHLDALQILAQLEGVVAYLDTLAPRSDGQALLRIRATIEAAYQRLHRRLHQQGLYHQHTTLPRTT